ncbi:expression site-associated gene (ESAG-like) protein [Trypanosoma conorhini]|uniref:Expression site-associated gene (ESAG-like) protein n=1 Tax=Trypanosoma conorhini TaxID=83891 RepID=A0A3R7PMB8_9TRYP|nr:expression site-associated gene (ESAG-like) protein [Trypanosoma conorhini]RNF22129.1 expression site-associated gene (ESAG-like) protein [Trypanosoma conorhini]
MMLSPILSRVSVVSIGFGAKRNHTVRPEWLLNYMEDAGLRGDDVVVMFDGAGTFLPHAPLGKAGSGGLHAKTAPSADAFNATAVHRGAATAPLLFEGGPACWAPHIDLAAPLAPSEHYVRCRWFYELVWRPRAFLQTSACCNRRFRGIGTSLLAEWWGVCGRFERRPRPTRAFWRRVMSGCVTRPSRAAVCVERVSGPCCGSRPSHTLRPSEP